MSRTTATICKFIGTISLGLLTGVTYTATTTTLPPLLALPTATPASQTFTHLRSLTRTQTHILSLLSSSSLLLAYAFSPRGGRHPYLLWATLAVGVGYAGEVYQGVVGGGRKGGKGKGKGSAPGQGFRMGEEERGEMGMGMGMGMGGSRVKTPDSSDEEEWEVEGSGGNGSGDGRGSGNVGAQVNGEAVREGMERWRGKMMGRMVVWGVGWLASVVGLWGDGV